MKGCTSEYGQVCVHVRLHGISKARISNKKSKIPSSSVVDEQQYVISARAVQNSNSISISCPPIYILLNHGPTPSMK